MRNWWRKHVLLPFLMIFVAGCGTPESVLQTNRLDGDAARAIAYDAQAIETVAVSLEVVAPQAAQALHELATRLRTAALNIAEGSALIERKLGSPQNPIPYTAEAHHATIVQGNKDVDAQEAVGKGITGWIQSAVTKVADLVWPGLGGILMGAFFWLRKKTQYDNLKAGTAPIVKVLEDHPDIQTKIMDYAGKIGVGAPVKAAVDLLKPDK
jgi:nitrogen fixation-related uncharacterized protein